MGRKPEVMSPAGYWPQLHAAIEAGADAVYFGLKHFSARAKVGFSLTELPQAMDTLRRRGVRGYVTFNTLVFEHEFPDAARAIAASVEGVRFAQTLGMQRVTLARELSLAEIRAILAETACELEIFVHGALCVA